MTLRPQYAYPPPPPGWKEEDFVYFFDPTTTPQLAINPTVGNFIAQIILPLQKDAEFRLRGIQISGNTGSMQIRFYDPFGNELAPCLLEADREWSGTLNGAPPIGKLPVMVEPEIPCPAGGFLQVDVLVL